MKENGAISKLDLIHKHSGEPKSLTADFLKSHIKDVQLDMKKEAAGDLSQFEHIRVTKEKDIPRPEPTITIGDAAVAAPGNITGIGAPIKAGKTATTSVMIAGAISKTGDIDGFEELKVKPNIHGHAVIGIDTEQSEADQQYNVITAMQRAGFEETPEYFLSYNFRQLNFEDYQTTTNKICEAAFKKFGGIHLLIFDGGADYTQSVNDEAEAKKIVQYFTHLTINYNCPAIIVVHQNPGSDKERGHFGSEIQRKCYGLLTISKEGDISTLAPKVMRKAGFSDVPLIHFKYNPEKGYHTCIEAPNNDREKDEKSVQRHLEIAKAVFAPLSAMKHAEAVQAIMLFTKKGERTAKTMISNMSGWNQITKGNDNLYRICN